MKEILSMEQVTYLLKGFILLVIVTVLLACSDSDNPSPPEDPPIIDPPTSTLPETGNKEISKALMGTWKTRCLSKKEGTGSAEATWSFTMTDFSHKFVQYSDNNCSNKDDSSGLSGTYSVGIEEITSPEDYLAYDIDFISSDGSTSVKSLVSLSKDKTTFLLPLPDTTRPSDFSKAFEYTKTKGDDSSSDLEGRWGTNCLELKDGESAFVEFSVKKSQFTQTFIFYSDANCKKEGIKSDFSGETVIGKTVTTDDSYTATELDLELDDGDISKLLYATAKAESGKDALIVSVPTEGGSRPTTLKPALEYFELGDSKRSSDSSVKEPESLRSAEIQGYSITTESTSYLEEKLKKEASISGNTGKDLFDELRELHDQIPSQEGLRSGAW